VTGDSGGRQYRHKKASIGIGIENLESGRDKIVEGRGKKLPSLGGRGPGRNEQLSRKGDEEGGEYHTAA